MTRMMIYTLMVSTTLVCMAPAGGWAMLAPAAGQSQTDQAAGGRTEDLKKVQTALESKIVRERLKALGLSDQEIESRLSKLSDQQIHQLAKDIDTLAPGGDVGGVLVLVILVLLIVYLIDRL